MSKKEMFFCGASIRPSTCTRSSNICCIHCEINENCYELTKLVNKDSVKKTPLPCVPKNVDVEGCEYLC